MSSMNESDLPSGDARDFKRIHSRMRMASQPRDVTGTTSGGMSNLQALKRRLAIFEAHDRLGDFEEVY